MVDSKVRLQTTIITRLNMLFIPTLLVKAEFIAILGMLSNAENVMECHLDAIEHQSRS